MATNAAVLTDQISPGILEVVGSETSLTLRRRRIDEYRIAADEAGPAPGPRHDQDGNQRRQHTDDVGRRLHIQTLAVGGGGRSGASSQLVLLRQKRTRPRAVVRGRGGFQTGKKSLRWPVSYALFLLQQTQGGLRGRVGLCQHRLCCLRQ